MSSVASCKAPLPAYTVVDQGEQHVRRYFEILKQHPEIEQLFGYDPRTAYISYAVVAVQIGIAYVFGMHHALGTWVGSWWMIVGVALFVGAIFAHWAAVCIHECSHHLVASTPARNRLVAIAANLHVLVPAAMPFWRHHMRHHSHLGIEGIDNDLPQEFEVRYINTPLRKLVWLACYMFFAVFARGFWNKPNRWEILNIAVQLSANVLILWLVGPVGIAYLALSLFFGFGIHPVAGHFVHEHYQWVKGQETYSYYGSLNGVNLNIGYHIEHHDFMKVPGRRLPELHAIAKEYYAPFVAHNSWLYVYWMFVTRNELGHHSRFVRTQETFNRARRELAKLVRGTRAPRDLQPTAAARV